MTYPTGAAARNQITNVMPLTTAQLDVAIRLLQDRHVPFVTGFINPTTGVDTKVGGPAYVAFVNPLTWKTAKNLSGVDKVEKYQAGNVTFPNEVGKYDAIRFVLSTTGYKAAGAGSGGVDVQLMPIMGSMAFARSTISEKELVPMVRDVDSPDSADKLGQKGHVGWKAYFVAKILDQDKIQRAEFYAS